MVLTAQDLKTANISIPILVGGAALSRKFTDQKISPEYDGPVLYAKDAMDGLSLANKLRENPDAFLEKRTVAVEEKQNRQKSSKPVMIIEKIICVQTDRISSS